MVAVPSAKPCPFCKGPNAFVERMDTCVYRAVCDDCGAMGPPVEHGDYGSFEDETREERAAIRAWNRRPGRSALVRKEEPGDAE